MASPPLLRRVYTLPQIDQGAGDVRNVGSVPSLREGFVAPL
jgi:hypothetical protein